MTDTIFITGVVIHARHGVMEHETEVGQRFVIDLELSIDLSESSRTDRLADTVSYSNVVATATAAFKDANYKLLERAAGAVADAILAAFPRVSAIKVTVHKPHARIAAIFANLGGMTQAALLARSSDYAPPPWGEESQARFVNACIEIETSLDPHALLFTLHKIEKKFGRDRAQETRWGPRPLDLDLIAYDDLTLAKPELTLPHPRLFERAFVLVPLVEIVPDRLIAGRDIKAALAGLSTDGIERLPELAG